MIVAQLRGVKFIKNLSGYWNPPDNSRDEANRAVMELADWLGFKYSATLTTDYLRALEKKRSKIFLRAKNS
jgi:hypothetical protein